MKYTVNHKPMAHFDTIEIEFENIDRMYVGKGHSCRCGCQGEYYNPKENQKIIQETLERMSNNTYDVLSIDNCIFEILVDEENDIVHTLYLKK